MSEENITVSREVLEAILLDIKQGAPGYARWTLEKILNNKDAAKERERLKAFAQGARHHG